MWTDFEDDIQSFLFYMLESRMIFHDMIHDSW